MKSIICLLAVLCSSSVAFGQLDPKDYPASVKIKVGGATYNATQAEYDGGCDVGWADNSVKGLFPAITPRLALFDKAARVEIATFSQWASYHVDGPAPYAFPLTLRLIASKDKPNDPAIGGSWPSTITITE